MASPTPSPGALPTYVQISEAIARRITAGQWLDGERLPPERTMAAEFGVAVGTLRKALKPSARSKAFAPCPRIRKLH